MGDQHDRDTVGPSFYTSSVANSMMGRSILGRLSMRQLLRIRDFIRLGSSADSKLTQRRPLYVISLLLLLAGLLTQFALIFICGLLVLGITIVPELWYRYGLRGLVVARETGSGRISFGQVATVPLLVENRKLLPLPMVETVDEFPESLTVLGARLGLSARPGSALLERGLRLWAFQRVRRRYYVRAIQRGAYNLGPTLVRVTDPFGILTREETFETRQALLVHPLIAPLDRFDLTPRAIFGDHATRTRLLEDPLRVAGIREYAPGDDPRRVHWKATARMGALQSKLLDPSTQRTLLIALDVRTFNRAQLGYDPDLAELGIAVAASVASWATERGYAVGLISNSAISNITPETDGRPAPSSAAPSSAALALPRLRLEPAARPEQLTLILDSLARVRLFGGAPMGPRLTQEMRSTPTGATLVYVGLESLVDVTTMIALRRIQASGHAVSLALTARDSDDPFATTDDAHDLHAAGLRIHHVGGRARWQALLQEALSDLPPRKATDAPNAEHLAAEHRLIAHKRKARVDWRIQRKSEESHAEPEQQRREADNEDDGDQSEASHPPALALP
jgi:uncharacterized protein (DUF58 family)